MYFHVRIILLHLGLSLPHEDGFSNVKNPYIKSEYYSICNDYGVNADEIWMHRDWFYIAFLAMEESLQNDLHQTILHNG